MFLVLFLHAFQFWQDGTQHGDKAQTAANDIGHRFCQENAICSHMHCIGHQISQRYNNKYFTKQGEENRLLLFIQ